MVFIGSVLIIVIMSLWNSHAWEEEKKERKWEKEKGEGRGWCLDPGRLSQTSVAVGAQRPLLQAALLLGCRWPGSRVDCPGGAACSTDLRWAEPGLACWGCSGPELHRVSVSLGRRSCGLFRSYSLPPSLPLSLLLFLNFCSFIYFFVFIQSLLLKCSVKTIFAGHKSWLHLIMFK